MRNHLKIGILLLPLLLLASCATTGGGPGLNLVSQEEEIRLGKELSAQVDKEQPVLRDPALEAYVNEIGRRIVASTERPNLPYTFKIIKGEEVNAFSLPGGPVYVYTGLLKFADNEAELASVIGHEVAHVTQRHATEQLTRAYGLEVLTSIVLGQNAPAAAQVAGSVAGSLGLLKFSRSDEIESDRMGARYMFRAGYNPTAMITFHEKLLKLGKSNQSAVINLFSTHPMSQARIDAVASEIAKFPPGQNVQYYPERYQQLIRSELR